jgi:hypothetical protein
MAWYAGHSDLFKSTFCKVLEVPLSTCSWQSLHALSLAAASDCGCGWVGNRFVEHYPCDTPCNAYGVL